MHGGRCVYAFERRGGGQRIVAVFNFSDVERCYDLPIIGAESLRLLITTDDGESLATDAMPPVKDETASLTLGVFAGRLHELR